MEECQHRWLLVVQLLLHVLLVFCFVELSGGGGLHWG